MTPRERAIEATWEAGCPDWGRDDREQLETAVEQAIIAAVEEERGALVGIAKKEQGLPIQTPHPQSDFAEGYSAALDFMIYKIRFRSARSNASSDSPMEVRDDGQR